MLRRLLLLLLLLHPAADAWAQKGPEAFPFFGVRMQGGLRRADDDRTVQAGTASGFGAAFDYGLTETFQLEVLWTRASSEFQLGPPATVDPEAGETGDPEGTPLLDVTIDYLLAGFLYGGGGGAFRPYVSAGIGTGIFDPAGPVGSRQTHFSFTVGTGFKSYFHQRLGFRFDARAFGTRGTDPEQPLSCLDSSCIVFDPDATFWQGHVTAGIVVLF